MLWRLPREGISSPPKGTHIVPRVTPVVSLPLHFKGLELSFIDIQSAAAWPGVIPEDQVPLGLSVGHKTV